MVERITLAQQHAVNEQRRMGRTDRQAEKIVGLPHGILSRPSSSMTRRPSTAPIASPSSEITNGQATYSQPR